MLKLKTKELKRNDAKVIKEFISLLRKQNKSSITCEMHLINAGPFKVHYESGKVYCSDRGYYIPGDHIICCHYKGLSLKYLLETLAHEFKHFIQDLEEKKIDMNDEEEADGFAKDFVREFGK